MLFHEVEAQSSRRRMNEQCHASIDHPNQTQSTRLWHADRLLISIPFQRNDFTAYRAPIQMPLHNGDPVNAANLVGCNAQVKDWSAIKIVKSENAMEADFFTKALSPTDVVQVPDAARRWEIILGIS